MGVGTRIVSTRAAVPFLGHARASRPCQARHTANGKVNFAIALGLTHAHDLAGIGEGLLDSPPRRVAGHQIFRGRFQIGGDQRKSITAVVTAPSPGLVVTHQNDAHGSTAKRSVPALRIHSDLGVVAC